MLVVQNIQWLESLDFNGYFELEKEELLSGERYAAGEYINGGKINICNF